MNKLFPGLAALALALAFPVAAKAADRVVATVPPLHSLVSVLLDGVDRPGLAFADKAQLERPVLEDSIKKRLDAARMVVWSGPDYETALHRLRSIDPAQGLKGMTLGSLLPTLVPMGEPGAGGKRDLRFWLDPRLAKIAVGRLAPNLARLYPDGAERILDNEIDLKKRLKALEAKMQASLDNLSGDVPLDVPESDVLYLAWRFNLAVPHCATAAQRIEGFGLTPGQDLYFVMMGEILKDLNECRMQAMAGS